MKGASKMIPKINAYNEKITEEKELHKITNEEIEEQLMEYLQSYRNCFVRSQQIKYFNTYEKGLLSNLDRKTIEPIALSFLGEKEVRGMQQFFTRSKGWDEAIEKFYKKKAAEHLSDIGGFLSVDESDFAKKGNDSVGVTRQYCGRLGKTENCQAGVFLSYATEKGIGLLDSRLYLPNEWFKDEYAQKREECQIPEDRTFQTKNEMAKEMINNIIENQLFNINCIGCDASFGSDGTFLDNIPDDMNYFASVRKNEHIFREMPEVVIPENISGNSGGKFKHPRSKERPVHIKTIIDDESIPWVKRAISEGTKGPIIAEVKSLRCISCRKENRLFVPKAEIWVYIRKHEDGTIKYFVSNMPADTIISELDRLATARWSIEQCFQECKSYLGMTHYETRSYPAWYRHMQLVMIAQLFVTVLRNSFKKTDNTYNADDTLHNCIANTDSNTSGIGGNDYSLSIAPQCSGVSVA